MSTKEQMIFIHPPVTRPSEPPAGIARLAGALKYHGIPVAVIDANIEGLLFLLEGHQKETDTWTKGAVARLGKNLSLLRSSHGYTNIDRYARAVSDITRMLQATTEASVKMSLKDYQDASLSPLKISDLMYAAEHPERNLFFPYFSTRLKDINEKFVGFSLNYLSQALTTFSMIGFIKQICPEVKIILGGGLVSSWMSRPEWKNPWSGLIDGMIAGPGEEQVLSMLGKVECQKCYPPDYTDFPLDQYLAPGPILPYSASSGCFWGKCSFCPERAEKNPYRPISPSRVSTDIDGLIEKMQPSMVHFLDNALSPTLLEHLAENPVGTPWYGFSRITPHLADKDFCQALKHSGCVMLQLGIESGDQKVLDELNKGIDLGLASKVLGTLKQAGIASYVYLLFGTPAETETSAKKTLEFTVTHSHAINFLNIAIFNLPIFGPDVEHLNTGSFYEGDLSLYHSFVHPTGWNRSNVRVFLDKEFKRHPAIQPILRRDPPVFTSNHAPFFAL